MWKHPVIGKLLGFDVDWRPNLSPDEHVLAEGAACDRKGFFGGNVGPLILTNRRLIWRQAATGPLKRSSLDLPLADIANVGQTTILSALFGGRRLQLRMKRGRDHRIWVAGLDEWIDAIRAAKDAAERGIAL